MTSRQNRKARRAAERTAHKLQSNDSALSPKAARQDEATFLSEPKTSANAPAEHAIHKAVGPEYDHLQGNEDLEQNHDCERVKENHTAPPPIPAISLAQLAANRANAQLSTGPTSNVGKTKSSKNALKTALTGRTVLLPEDDAERYEQHLNRYSEIYHPKGERESEIVQSLADATWRLDRIPGLEEAIYVKGCNEFAAEVTDLDPRARLTMLRMHTYLAYERQFRNLQTQEMRLHRLREKLAAEFKELQKEREQKEKDELAIAARLNVTAKHDRKQQFDPTEYARTGSLVPFVHDSKDGFEFSTADLEAFLNEQRASFMTEKAMTAQGR